MNAKSVISKIVFADTALQVFWSEIQKFGTIETGGVLVGYVENDTIHIEKACDSGPDAQHTLTSFQADPNYVDMFIDLEYANSGGKNIYIGEWHTHPQITPSPSPTDIQSLDEIAVTTSQFALVVIIGAVHYSPVAFRTQSIALLEYNNRDTIYSLEIQTR